MLPTFDEITSNFEYLEEWDDRYRYLIELGREMPTLAAEAHSEANKVQGCASQVWLDVTAARTGDEAVVSFTGDSDAHIVKGLVALLVSLLSGKPASEILSTDALGEFGKLGLAQHLTPQRSNGLASMVTRIRSEAQKALS